MKMLNGNVLVKLDSTETDKTQSGIILNSNFGLNYKKVKVIESDERNDLQIGDSCYISKHSGTPFRYNDIEYLIIHVSEIVVIE